MSDARIIDGKAFAADARAALAARVAALTADRDLRPALTVILVGDDPASQVYVRNKGRAATEVGIVSDMLIRPASTSQHDLLADIARLNADPAVHGILVQLPLPAHIDERAVIAAIDPAKDVDGFHPINVGKLASGMGALIPCTPLGCLKLLQAFHGDMSGADALVIGRSNIVGKPMAQLLLAESATVTVAHSRTRDLPSLARRADILVAAVGRPEFVQGDWIKAGATVIDVGINRIEAPERGPGKTRLVGDVDFAAAIKVAGAVTPVPGGVGPMTIAMLLENTVTAAIAQQG